MNVSHTNSTGQKWQSWEPTLCRWPLLRTTFYAAKLAWHDRPWSPKWKTAPWNRWSILADLSPRHLWQQYRDNCADINHGIDMLAYSCPPFSGGEIKP